jgi:23S rRNA maturation-related 3'-5' exoribonuclease YhaM
MRKHWKVVKVVGQDIVPMNEEVLKEISQEHIEEVMPVEEETSEKVEAEVAAPVEEKPVKKARKTKEKAG